MFLNVPVAIFGVTWFIAFLWYEHTLSLPISHACTCTFHHISTHTTSPHPRSATTHIPTPPNYIPPACTGSHI